MRVRSRKPAMTLALTRPDGHPLPSTGEGMKGRPTAADTSFPWFQENSSTHGILRGIRPPGPAQAWSERALAAADPADLPWAVGLLILLGMMLRLVVHGRAARAGRGAAVRQVPRHDHAGAPFQAADDRPGHEGERRGARPAAPLRRDVSRRRDRSTPSGTRTTRP